MVAPAYLDATLPVYFKEIAHLHGLSEDEEISLSSRIQKGDREALHRLVSANLRFVAKIALRYQHHGLPLSDLISEGNWGLIQAAQRFDGRRNFKFISYAVWWIRHAILQALSEKGRLIRQPETQNELFRHLSKAEHALEQRLGRQPSESELASELGVTEEKIAQVMAWRNAVISLDAPVETDDTCTLHDVIPAEGSGSERSSEEEGRLEELSSVLKLLDSREGKVVQLYFGLNGIPCHTLSEVGKQCNLTGERVRQVKQRALRKLRSYSRIRALPATVYHGSDVTSLAA